MDGDGEAGETSEMGKGGRVIWGVSINASQPISSATTGVEYSYGVWIPKEEEWSYVIPRTPSSVESRAG